MEGNTLPANDHRRLGQELDLFIFSDLVGPGLPLWTPRGTLVRQALDDYVQEMRDEKGFQAVTIPHITKKDLYQKSGHWTKFKDDLFHISSREGHEFAMKPMNCPHHAQIYASSPRSYRDLPIRYRETTMNYRDEQTGELNGILRGRAFTQDDAHVFCREEDIVAEVIKLWDIVERFYKAFGFDLSLRFSTRDPKTPDAYSGTNEIWDKAEAELAKAIAKKGQKVADGVGEAAFYGPKLDFMATDSLKREWQVATIQLDFAQPEGLGLNYVDEEGKNQQPVMIHCAIMGSIERFLAVLLEHTDGKFPLWVAPEQLRIITLNDDAAILKFAQNVVNDANKQGIRNELDDSNESVSKKIAKAEHLKIPYAVVIGENELKSGKVSPRVRADLAGVAEVELDTFLAQLAKDSQARK